MKTLLLNKIVLSFLFFWIVQLFPQVASNFEERDVVEMTF